jgi:hypothetical protein
MNLTNELVLIVSRVSSHEAGFFDNWGMTVPMEAPYAVYLNGAGTNSLPRDAQLTLIDGNKDNLKNRVLTVLSICDVSIDKTFLLIHTGNNRKLVDLLAALDEDEDIIQRPQDWVQLCARAFSLWGRGGLYPSFILNELCDYSRSSKSEMFRAGLAFLRDALRAAIQDQGEGVEKTEGRSDFASIYLIDSERRQRIGLVKSKPRLKRNPVAALIHDVLSRFDPLYIDFQVAESDKAYWESVKENYKGKVLQPFNHLQELLTHSAENVGDLETIRAISNKIMSEPQIEAADKQRLNETVLQLQLLVSAQANSDTISLIKSVDEVTKTEISTKDLENLRNWLGDLRKHFGAIDHLYKKSGGVQTSHRSVSLITEQ